MASRPSGMDLSNEQAVLVACSTQVCSPGRQQGGLGGSIQRPVRCACTAQTELFLFSSGHWFTCAVQGDGVPPTEAREFCDWLFAGKAGPLQHLHFSVCALGDR